MATDSRGRRRRRSLTDEFRAGAVRHVIDEGKSVGQAARDLDLTESALRNWVDRARADRGKGRPGVLTTAAREELSRLRKEHRELRMERDIRKESRGLLREEPPGRFTWIEAEKAEPPLTVLCRCLRVSPSGFYAWRERPESPHRQTDRRWRVLGRAWFDESRQRYGSPRIHADLLDQDVRVSRKRVVRLMQEAGLNARVRKRFTWTTMSDHDQPVAAHVLNREFTADAPNQRWVGDTTAFLIGESGKLCLAAIVDLFSRFVVGWAVSAVNDRPLVVKALEMAVKRRWPGVGWRHHSAQGSPYASEDDQTILDTYHVTCSLSRRGNCDDHAVMESFFSTMKSELGDRFEAYGIAKDELFDFLEVFDNQRRRHSTLGLISPAAFERPAVESQAA